MSTVQINSKRFYRSKVLPGFSPFKLVCCEIIVRFLVFNYCCKALFLRHLQESWINSLHRFYYGNSSLFFILSVRLVLHMILRVHLQHQKMICVAVLFSYCWCCAAMFVLCGAVLCCVVLYYRVVKEPFSLSREEVARRCSINKVY